jgi:hypothetical protein
VRRGRARRRNGGTATTASFVTVLLLAELGARAISGGVELTGSWTSGEASIKVEQMERIADRGGEVQVVVVGDSMTASAIDPRRFTEASGVSSYNAAWAGVPLRTTVPWTIDIVEPMLHPEVIIVGVQTRTLNDKTPSSDWRHRSFLASPGYRQAAAGLAARAEGLIERISYFMRYRRSFREPSELLGGENTRSGRQQKASKKVIGDQGVRIEENVTFEPRLRWMQKGFGRELAEFSAGGIEYEALLTLHRELQERGIRMIVMSMPITDVYEASHGDPEQAMNEYHSTLRRFVAQTGVTLIDAEDAFDTNDPFRDPLHVDVEGRTAIAKALGQAWDEVLDAHGSILAIDCNLDLRCRIIER